LIDNSHKWKSIIINDLCVLKQKYPLIYLHYKRQHSEHTYQIWIYGLFKSCKM